MDANSPDNASANLVLTDARSLLLVLDMLRFLLNHEVARAPKRARSLSQSADELTQSAQLIYDLAMRGEISKELTSAVQFGADLARKVVIALEPKAARALSWIEKMKALFVRNRSTDLLKVAAKTLARLEAIAQRASSVSAMLTRDENTQVDQSGSAQYRQIGDAATAWSQ